MELLHGSWEREDRARERERVSMRDPARKSVPVGAEGPLHGIVAEHALALNLELPTRSSKVLKPRTAN